MGNPITLALLKVHNQIVKHGWTGLIILVSFVAFSNLCLTANLRLPGWLTMTSYYATAFKTGTFPPISKDQVVMWSRPHPAFATAPDPVPQPANYQIVSSFLGSHVIWI